MATRIHPKNVHEKSPKNVHEMSPKKRTSRGQKCPRNVTKSVHEMSPLLSTRCHLLCPRDVCHPFLKPPLLLLEYTRKLISHYNSKIMFFNCLLFQIGKFSNWHTFVNSREGRVVKIFINGRRMRTTSPLIIRDGKACFARTSSGHRFKFLDTELQR